MARITMTRTIDTAREYLKSGNGGAYARLLSAAIRASGDDRVSMAIIRAIADDKAAHLFSGLGTSCPTAA
ncbi:hypothetical protein [Rhizobium leguminosarum]